MVKVKLSVKRNGDGRILSGNEGDVRRKRMQNSNTRGRWTNVGPGCAYDNSSERLTIVRRKIKSKILMMLSR